MVDITASMVKELREKSGAGMMDCKKALGEVNGNIEEAVDWLRKKGLAAAAKKAGRVAAEGLVSVATSGLSGVVVEINAETDFVARNDKFQDLVKKVATIALDADHTVDSLGAASFPGEGDTVNGAITHLVAVIGENMGLRRVKRLSVTDGVVTSYMHSAVAPNIGKIGVLVALESTGDKEKLADLGKKIAMHIAATQPKSLDTSSLDPETLERERNVLIEQARASGKPEEFIMKMVEGRVRKFYEEVVLLEQSFVMDPSRRVSQVVEDFAKEIGHPVKLVAFERFMLGEGIEKVQTDFAEEVKAQANR